MLLLGLLLAWPTPGWCGLVPIPAPQLQALENIPGEKPYDVRMHFLQSNERRHDMFFSALRGRGGAYVGVGADQNYTLAAIAGASVLYLIDIDEWVIQWHRIYAAVVPIAPTPAELIDLFAGTRDLQVAAALEVRWGTAAPPLFRAFRRDRARLLPYLRRQLHQRQDGQTTTWLSDPILYDHVRELMTHRRVVAQVGDLHGESTLRGAALVLRGTGQVVRTVYLSNAEQWFRYSEAFRRNMAALPGDASTVVLRTLARREVGWPEGDRWHFSVQTLDDFVRRLRDTPPLALVQALLPDMIRQERTGGVHGLSWLGGVTAAAVSQRPSLPSAPLTQTTAAQHVQWVCP